MADDKARVNGIDLFSKLTGLPPDEIKGIWEAVKVNNAKLASCPGPHDFQPVGSDKPSSLSTRRFRCARCSGVVDAREKKWYDAGLAHGMMKV